MLDIYLRKSYKSLVLSEEKYGFTRNMTGLRSVVPVYPGGFRDAAIIDASSVYTITNIEYGVL